MKKFAILGLVLVLLLTGCGKSDINDNISEITTIYFSGENEGDYASISVGEREEPYIKDGKSGTKVPFSLVCLTVENIRGFLMPATIIVSGEERKIELELVCGVYMCDLGQLKESNEISLRYEGGEIAFTRQDFDVTCGEAMEIARANLDQSMRGSSECYLKIVRGEGRFYWCFTVIYESGLISEIIIDMSGNILKDA